MTITDADWAFAAYEAVRHRLPDAIFPEQAVQVSSLDTLADDHDVFLLDAYGVLNRGEIPIPGAPERIAGLQAMGKRVMVVTNAASYPKPFAVARLARLGFRFAPEDIVSSRDTLLAALAGCPARRWGMMARRSFGHEEIEHLGATFLGDDPADYDAAEAFVFFGSGDWNEQRQSLLTDSLHRNPRLLMVGNPDIVAPLEDGFSREPGYHAHRVADAVGIAPQFFGKPFGNIFDLALARVPGVDPARIVMVGDTLQTDILGGRAAGVKTALVTGHGALLGADVTRAIAVSGIVPDYIMSDP